MPSFARAFAQAIQDTRSAAQLDVIRAALEAGDFEAAIRLLQVPQQYFAPLDQSRVDAFVQGGVYAYSRLPKKPYPGSGRVLLVRFQGQHPRAEQWTRQKSSTFIQGINQDQRQAVRKAIEAGLSEGRNPRQVALDLVGRRQGSKRVGGIVGLTSQQTDWVIARRAKLQNEGRPVDQVDRMVERYKSKLLKQRGETIARTESIAAFNAGRFEAMQQLVDNGSVQSIDQIEMEWSATGDARTRDFHWALNGTRVKLGEAFVSPSGSQLRYPGDTELGAGPEDVINCRCTLFPKINWLAQVT